MKRLILITGLLIAVLSVPIMSEATPVAINNPGFESDILADSGWQYGISGWIVGLKSGVFNPSVSQYPSGIPEGNNVAFISGSNISGSNISQQLSYTLIPNTQLTLNVDVGWRLDLGMPEYAIQLWAGNTLLASESSTPLVKGGCVTSMLKYNVTNLDPYLGQPLLIALTRTGGGQVNFDNVGLTNESTTPVPEPSTLLLLGSGLVSFGYYIRRRKG